MKAKNYKFKPYYMMRPHLWREPIKSIDLRTAISSQWSYAYIRIPKAANSTIIRTLQNNFPDKQITSKSIGDIKKQYLHFSDLGLWNVLWLPRQLFIFTVVRNPYSRILSAYLNKVASQHTTEHINHAGVIAPHDDGNLSFRAFCRYLAAGGEYENPHWMRQSRILGVSDRIDYIGKVESLEEDLDKIVKRIAPESKLMVERQGQQTNASDKLKEYYDPECREIVEDVYARDFQYLGYEKKIT